MQYTFRKANPVEADEILKLYRSVVGETFCTWNESYPAEAEIQYDLSHDDLFVLEDGMSIVAACSIVAENELDDLTCWQYTNAGEIARIVVRTDHRGRSLAQQMVQTLAKELKSRGKQAIHLLVAQKNIPAYRTYMRCGFLVRGSVHMYENDYDACEKYL